jgi:hypothetical protein
LKRTVTYVLFSLLVVTKAQAQTPCTWTNQAASVVETCGSVGVGTTTPLGIFELKASQPLQTIRYTDPASWGDLLFYENDTAKAGVLSIGSTFPYDAARVNALELWNWAQGPIIAYAKVFTLGSYPSAPNPGVPGVFQVSTGAGTPVSSRLTFGTDGSGWKFAVAKNQAGAVSDLFTIQDNGRVGIGTTSPQYTLDVNGSIRATQVIGAVYQDVAEWVPAGAPMHAGTVVVLDLGKTNEVIPSQHAYDTAVAGVVSAFPGLILGEESSSKAKIATTGRVPVHVDASRRPIRVGDLLVTSDKPGTAMRSEPLDLSGVKIHRPGTIIGKALAPLDKGEGEILVLLSLQ